MRLLRAMVCCTKVCFVLFSRSVVKLLAFSSYLCDSPYFVVVATAVTFFFYFSTTVVNCFPFILADCHNVSLSLIVYIPVIVYFSVCFYLVASMICFLSSFLALLMGLIGIAGYCAWDICIASGNGLSNESHCTFPAKNRIWEAQNKSMLMLCLFNS